jgi:hypothetical protein
VDAIREGWLKIARRLLPRVTPPTFHFFVGSRKQHAANGRHTHTLTPLGGSRRRNTIWNQPEDVLKVDADEDGVGGDDTADCLRYLDATKSRVVVQRKLRGL